MISKLLICPYFGPTPRWMPYWLANVKRNLEPSGYDVLMDTDEAGFKERVRRILGVEAPPLYGGGKTWDYRPALGMLYQEELWVGNYDFWGHTDFDCVYGRVDCWLTDSFLRDVDMHSNCATYVNGCWSLYRNSAQMRELFMWEKNWKAILEDEVPSGWAEFQFSVLIANEAEEGSLTKAWTQWQVYEADEVARLRFDGGHLMLDDAEVMMGHFRRTKSYPEGCK